MADTDSHRVNGSDSIEDGDIEKELRQDAQEEELAAAATTNTNDFANGGPVQDDLGQHARQKETGALEDGVQADRQVTPSVHSLRAIPNGGLQAWLQVLGSFFLFFNSWGEYMIDFLAALQDDVDFWS